MGFGEPKAFKSLKDLKGGKSAPIAPPPPQAPQYSTDDIYGYGTYGEPEPIVMPQQQQQSQQKQKQKNKQKGRNAEPEPAPPQQQHYQQQPPPQSQPQNQWSGARGLSQDAYSAPPPVQKKSWFGKRSNTAPVPQPDQAYSQQHQGPPQSAPQHMQPHQQPQTQYAQQHQQQHPQQQHQGGGFFNRSSDAHSTTSAAASASTSSATHTQEGRPRYVRPSERKEGEVFDARTFSRRERDATKAAEPQQTWTQWASQGATEAWDSTTGTVKAGWDSVNDSQNRQKAFSSVGNGAAKVAGGAIKYTAKGVWAVGKAAVR